MARDPNQRSLATNAQIALDDLSIYFGIGTSGIFGQVEAPDIVSKEILGGILSPQTSLPTTSAVLAEAENNSVLAEAGLLITPFDDVDVAFEASGIINAKFGSPSYQGSGAPKGACYSSQDFLPDSDSSEVETPVNVYQIFSTTQSPSLNGTDVSTYLMNCVPTIEWSRSVPFLEIQPIGFDGMAPITLRHFGQDTTDNQEDASGFNNAPFLKSADIEAKSKILGGMDIFTMPQTIINPQQFDDISKAGDPFRPMMSIESFSTAKYGAFKTNRVGEQMTVIGKNHTAQLKLRIHSKEGLNQFQDFIRPSTSAGSAKLNITFGWAHPDGVFGERASDANVSARIGDIINACRQSLVYQIKDSRFTFHHGNEVQVDIDLTPIGEAEIQNQLMSTVADLKSGQDSKDDLETFIKAAASAHNKDVWAVPFSRLVKKQGRMSGVTLSAEVKDAISAYLTELKNAKKEKTDPDNSTLEALFKVIFDDPNVVAAASKRKPSQIADLIISDMKKKPDPFLRPRFSAGKHNSGIPKAAGSSFNGSGYVSLGKVMTYFIGAVMRGLKNHAEAQIIFYGFNHNAGTKHDFNIAQFPIKLSDLTKLLKSEVSKHGIFSSFKFVDRVIGKFIGNNYAMKSFGLNPKENERNRTISLKQAYGIDKDSKSGLSFTPPDIKISSQTCLSRSTISNEGEVILGDPIYRIHVYDEKSTHAILAEDINKSFSTGFGFAKMKRDVTAEHSAIEAAGANIAVSSVNHQVKYEQDVQKLVTQGVLTSVTEEDTINKLAAETKQDKGKLTTALENFLFVKLVDEAGDEITSKIGALHVVRQALKEITGPYLLHETEGSAMTQASLQTSQDKALKNIKLKESYNLTDDEKKDLQARGITKIDTAALLMALDATFIGNPFFDLMQNYYIDFHTNTQADNVYMISSVTHDIKAGEFITKIKAYPPASKTTYVPLEERLATSIMSLMKIK